MNDDLEKQQIIEAIGTHSRNLLNSKWEAIQALRADPEKPFPISFQHRLAFRGDKQIVKTKISYGIRESESMETTIDNKAQMQLFGGTNGSSHGESAEDFEGQQQREPRFETGDEEGDEHQSIAEAAAGEKDPAPPLHVAPPPKKRGRGRPKRKNESGLFVDRFKSERRQKLFSVRSSADC